ncbi:MAG: caspase family protein [Nitrospira sp.]|nr:caspase family protein [Nitrospira sp.]
MKQNLFSYQSGRFLIPAFALFLIIGGALDVWAQQSKRALLIGIDEYKSDRIPDLRGCGNDVELMRNILVGKFNVPAEHVTVLKNEQATHAGIVQAIQTQLIAKAQPDEVIILHYSGHGSQMRDAEGDQGDEIDGLDETIVPHDSRTDGVFDISDDEINGLLEQLTQKTKNVTVILDSCHSGAAARGGTTVREIAPDDRVPPPAPAYARSSREVGEGDADFRLNGSNYVLISGCLASQLSNESVFNDRRHGVLTWFLAEALQAAGDTTTYEALMDEVKRDVTLKFPTQDPQLEGLGTNQVVFGTDKINTRPYVLVNPLEEGTVELAGGAVYGLRKDSKLEVYPPQTVDFDQATPSATIQVFQVDDYSAKANVLGGATIPQGSKAVLDAIHFGTTTIPLFLDEQASPALIPIRDGLASMEGLRLVSEERDAQLMLHEHNGNILVRSGDLELLAHPVPITSQDLKDRVINQVKDVVHWMTVLDLKNPNSNVAIEFHVRRQGDPQGSPSPQEIISGTYLTYTVTNKAAIPLFIYILDVSSDGAVYPVFPKEPGSQEALRAGQTWEKNQNFHVPKDHPSPKVVDVLKVIATNKPINPAIFPRGNLRHALPPDTRGFQDPLERFLALATHGTRAPGGQEEETPDSDSWVTAQTSFTIARPTVKVAGYSATFTQPQAVDTLKHNMETTALGEGQRDMAEACVNLRPLVKDDTVFEAMPCQASRGGEEVLSIGQAFDRAYAIQKQLGAQRVEPNLEVPMPELETERGIDKRSIGEDELHDPLAAQDDRWSLKQIRVAEAWQKIRDKYHRPEGAEAEGVLIAHPDTGYLPHPEIWAETNGRRPVDVAKGYNYYEGKADPKDPLLKDRLLDNPGHGTASGSVIVSPPGCQLPGAQKCVNGVARGAQLIPLRVHRTVAQFKTGNMTQAIQDVADGKIPGDPKLISIAMGGPPTFSMWKAVKAAEKKGVLIVAAAGNYVRTVVWPARFASTIAVAAHNVRCQHWKHSSHGAAVDISAPGESVWRATLNEEEKEINGMGKGTTFATGNTAGSAALWLAWHRDNPDLKELQAKGLVMKTFRQMLKESAWRPSTDPSQNPKGTSCEGTKWDKDYGPGMLDVARLLEQPLGGTRELLPAEMPTYELPELPLFSSLYPPGTNPDTIRQEYQALFGETRGSDLEDVASFETEILYHYTVNADVQRAVDGIVQTQRGGEPYARARMALRQQDLSQSLRASLLP